MAVGGALTDEDTGTPGTLPNPLGGERCHYSWRGHDIAYVRRGEGPPVVFVHSVHACAWSMEWRAVVPELSRRFTTYSLDLLGFGASGHPPLHYTGELFVELVQDFLAAVVAAPAFLVGSSLGGTYAVAVAARTPARVKGVCAVGLAGVTRLAKPGGGASGVVEKILRSSSVGAALFSVLTSKASIRTFLKDIYADRSVLTDEVLELYWAAARLPNARFGPAAFVGMRLNLDIRRALVDMPAPFMLVWGKDAGQTPLREGAEIRRLRPEAPFVILPGGDLPHEESPGAFVDALVPFLEGSSRP